MSLNNQVKPAGVDGPTMRPAAVAERLQDLLRGLVRRPTQIKHAIVAIESGDRSFRWIGTAGDAYPDGTPLRKDTPIFIASVTKLYIAATIMKLHERDLIVLGKSLSTYLPQSLIGGIHRLGGVDYTDMITVRHLLGHSSGLPDYLEDRPERGQSLMERLVENDLSWTIEEAMQIVRDRLTPRFPPQPLDAKRQKISYSDTNYQLLIAIIEAVSGQPLHVVFEEMLYRPLGLKHTFHPGTSVEPAPEPATLWLEEQPLDIPLAMRSFGDLVSTADDMLRFMRALIRGEIFDEPTTLDIMMGNWNTFGFSLNPAPTSPTWPIEYGLGMMRFRLPRLFSPLRPIPAVVGHTGISGSWLFYSPSYLIEQIEAGAVEAVYTIHISRLYRDQTLINALSLGELFKEHGIIIVTPQMRLNLRDKMHMRLYRMEIERAADELELMAHRLLGAKDIKARSGGYTGERLPPGFVVNEQEKLANGERNPDFHTYQIYKPHAEVVKIIFQRLSLPSESPTRVARYCKENDITFPPFLTEFDTPANQKTFVNTTRDTTGGWVITVDRIRKIATNPAYIGWKIWAGEVVSENIYPSIIDKETFWVVQKCFNRVNSPKKYDPLPLAGLLYCDNHKIQRKMTYTNGPSAQKRIYRCYERQTWENCMNIAASVLDDPISEAVLSQLKLGGFAEEVLHGLTDEFERAKEQAASYHREMRRLQAEIENLRGNLATGVMSNEQLKWLDGQVEQRLERIRELANLERQPIGEVVGRPVPDRYDIELVREHLINLHETWKDKPDRLKNSLLGILLDRVRIVVNTKIIRAQLIWRTGVEQCILIHRPEEKRLWTAAELKVLREFYVTSSKEELMTMLPERSWASIKQRGSADGLSRSDSKPTQFRTFTPEEDELVRAYYADEIDQETLQEKTGRTMQSILGRARRLGISWQPRKVKWEWHSNLQQKTSPTLKLAN